ncbi:MAG: hypothetical protein WDW38_007796 [Sanguina aurantia]
MPHQAKPHKPPPLLYQSRLTMTLQRPQPCRVTHLSRAAVVMLHLPPLQNSAAATPAVIAAGEQSAAAGSGSDPASAGGAAEAKQTQQGRKGNQAGGSAAAVGAQGRGQPNGRGAGGASAGRSRNGSQISLADQLYAWACGKRLFDRIAQRDEAGAIAVLEASPAAVVWLKDDAGCAPVHRAAYLGLLAVLGVLLDVQPIWQMRSVSTLRPNDVWTWFRCCSRRAAAADRRTD